MIFRDLNFIKQLKFSFLYKIISIVVSFLVVRMLLDYLGPEKYGVWSIILTFINWILFFDLGIANGVKNKVSESLSKKNIQNVKHYISTGYIVLFIFSLFSYILFAILIFFLDWQSIFNTKAVSNLTLQITLLVLSFFVLFNFTLSVINAVLNATQNTSKIVFGQLLSQLMILALLYLFSLYTKKNIVYISAIYGVSLLLANLIISYFFYKRNIQLIPSWRLFSKEKVSSIFALGLKFFFLQLTIFAILSTDKIIITQLLGPIYVSTYDILFKYFSVLTIIHSIINTPLWSMYTEAYQKNDYKWLKKILKKMIALMYLYIFISFIISYYGLDIIQLWLGKSDNLKLETSNFIFMGLVTLFLIWYSIFAYFTNGINKTRIQFITSLIGAIINVPLSIYFVNYLHMGLNGVLLATIFSLSIFCIFGPIQAFKEIKYMQLKNKKEIFI